MNIREYRPRLIDKKIQEMLSVFGAVCIEGPKWCGKTWTSVYHSKSQVFLGDPANHFQNRGLAQLNPGLVLEGERPHLVDEWQEVPAIWDAVRFEVDKSGEKGIFLLTGSATPNHKGILHSGTGRIARIKMRPMSLYESGDSTGEASLQDLFDGRQKSVMVKEADLRQLIDLTVRGGWPASVGMDSKLAAHLPRSYIEAVVADDIFKLDGIPRNLEKIELLLKSLARNESTTATKKKLQRDMREFDNADIDIDTVGEYLNIFNRLFLLDDQPAFSSNIRSSVRVKQAQKRHFVDPSLACALLGATSDILFHDLRTYGFMFESMCERDLKIYAESINGKLYHYQDYQNKEIDAVVELEDGRWGAFEIKLGAHQIDEAAKNLLSIQKKISEGEGKGPSLLCVICGMSKAIYKREDGIYVVPIMAMKN